MGTLVLFSVVPDTNGFEAARERIAESGVVVAMNERRSGIDLGTAT